MKNKIRFTQVTALFLLLIVLCSLYFLTPHKYDLFVSNNTILNVKINNAHRTLSLTQNNQIEDVCKILSNYTYKQRLPKEIDHSKKMNLSFDSTNFETSILEIYDNNTLFFNNKKYKVINKNKTNLYNELNTYALTIINNSNK